MTTAIVFTAILLALIIALYCVNKSREEQAKRAEEFEEREKAEREEIAKREAVEKKTEEIEDERQAKTGKVSTGNAVTDFDNSLDVLSDISRKDRRVSK